jgi:hypothetical protein
VPSWADCPTAAWLRLLAEFAASIDPRLLELLHRDTDFARQLGAGVDRGSTRIVWGTSASALRWTPHENDTQQARPNDHRSHRRRSINQIVRSHPTRCQRAGAAGREPVVCAGAVPRVLLAVFTSLGANE